MATPPASEARSVHLVGSVPLDDCDEVFAQAAVHLGPCLKRVPDGETGARSQWVVWQLPKLLATPGLAFLGVQDREIQSRPQIGLAEGASAASLVLGPLGYAEAAIGSYARFVEARRNGTLGAGQRFQVSLPTPMAILQFFIQPELQADFEPLYEAQMLKELALICAAVPHADLAIQWDTAVEFGILEGVMPSRLADPLADILDRLERLGNAVPADVELGYHLCYGDAGHQHFCEPADMRKLVDVANGIAARLRRPLTWIHMPVPRGRDDDAYFAPLADLALTPGTELYLGLVHLTDGVDGARRRMDTAARFTGGFGIATECGFGRRPKETVLPLMRIHAALCG